MKDVLKKIFLVVLSVIVIIFVIIAVWGDNKKGTHGFRDMGVVVNASTETSMTVDGLDYLCEESRIEVPSIKYIGGARQVGDTIDFRELLSVQYSDGTTFSGTQEGDFYLYLEDITDADGNRKVIFLTSEDSESLEEIPAPIVYEKDTRKICFYESGTYHVFIRIYGKSGGYSTYEFKLPVEID
ncbi:MAG: hypothetical protein UIC64_08850 [Agathobacter sp.]|nr:hypothetical protein [Agathobacter sp.]